MEDNKHTQWLLQKKLKRKKKRKNLGSEKDAIEQGLSETGKSRFCYFLISTRKMGHGISVKRYEGYPDSNSQFCVLHKTYAKDEDIGWKIHISVDPSQIPKAWDSIVELLMKYGVETAKVLKPDQPQPEYQAGKEITLYCQSTYVNWLKLLHEITEIFIANGIQPNYKPIHDKQLDGSVYFSCRSDNSESGEKLSSLEVKGHNPSGEYHFFEELYIYTSMLTGQQPHKPHRSEEQEHQIIEFYRWHQKICNIMLQSLQQTFPLVDSTIHKLPDGTFFSELLSQYNEIFAPLHTSEEHNEMWKANYSVIDLINDIQTLLKENYKIGETDQEKLVQIINNVKEQVAKIHHFLLQQSVENKKYLEFIQCKVDIELDFPHHEMHSLSIHQYKNLYSLLGKKESSSPVATCLINALFSKEIKIDDVKDISLKQLLMLDKRFAKNKKLDVKEIVKLAARYQIRLDDKSEQNGKQNLDRNTMGDNKEKLNNNSTSEKRYGSY